jgi:putative oxidoreductase
MPLIRRSLASQTQGLSEDVMLLAVRLIGGGLMLYGHGLAKLTGFSDYAARFPDIIGIGSTPALALATFAEFFCSALLMLGLLTRFAALNLVITMGVAVFIAHAADPLAKKELALVFLTLFLVPLTKGGGRFSVDRAIS